MPTSSSSWTFWIDRGGTFTDIVARAPDGRVHVKKLLSTNPEQYEDAAIAGIRLLIGCPDEQPIQTERIAEVRMGTTVATNALLERKGAPTVWVTTRGFRDALRIGNQARADLFALHIQRPSPLYTHVIEVEERIGARGKVWQPLAIDAARGALQEAYDTGFRSCAIALMHGYRFPEHEDQLAAIAASIGYTHVSVSHRISRRMQFIGRADTTVVDAYLSPVLHRYARTVANALPQTPLRFMKSDGGLVDAQHFDGKDAILSGPAGGIVASAQTGKAAGFDKIIGFDMGGTSTDVSHYAGHYERSTETVVAGVRMRTPMMQIHTVAAGGGSILHFDGDKFAVGPDSAGADPGPACYRRGGPLTVTDCNVMLGKLQPAFFPHVFGPSANEALDDRIVKDKFEALAQEIQQKTGKQTTPYEVAKGFLRIAVDNMAHAIKKISVQRGYDVTHYALNCFGGAGPQHACLVADALDIPSIIIHPYGGVLSAYGMGLATFSAQREAPIHGRLEPDHVRAAQAMCEQLQKETIKALRRQTNEDAIFTSRWYAELKIEGTNTTLDVSFDDADVETMRTAFEKAYQMQFGFLMPHRALFMDTVRVETIAEIRTVTPFDPPEEASLHTSPTNVQTWMTGEMAATPVHRRESLARGCTVEGPAIIEDPVSTIVVEPGWHATVDRDGALNMRRSHARPKVRTSTESDPVLLEVYRNLFMSIAEQMGTTLQKTALSANVKERLDFSCAIFDAHANLVSNAPHIPVHLGSMSASVAEVIAQRGDEMRPNDVFMLNDPYHGGTHLPDITVITPVFDAQHTHPQFYVASRAHHADVGGITPGSMPPHSHHIDEEGVLIRDRYLVKNGVLQEDDVRTVFQSAIHPARNWEDNLADLRAQIAANAMGVRELQRIVARDGLAVVQAYMRHLQHYAEEQVRRVLETLPEGHIRYSMDNGAVIEVTITVDRSARQAVIDFTGTSAQQHDNFNAPKAITRAAVLYVLRTLIPEDIPLNDGCLTPVELRIPHGSMLAPAYPAAVVAGNVEVSQAVTNALYLAMGVLAAGPGTMNNVTFGNDRYQYYETIAGGSPAGPDFDGTDAVQTHMTNSRMTDPEVLEWRFPVLLDAFEIRTGSGGEGRTHGGEGVERRLRFLEEMHVAIVSNMRASGPPGVAGGGAGLPGDQWIERADGTRETMGARDAALMLPGDVFVVRTPGGGGMGLTPS